MDALKGRIVRGHLVVDEPMDFPEGTVLELTITDPGDDLDDSERAALHGALSAAWASAREGRLQPAEVLLAKVPGEGTRSHDSPG